MARGAYSKEVVSKKIMEVFPDAFIASDGKTIRVPVIEEGERIEIKVSLVAAKDCEGGDEISSNVSNASSINLPQESLVSEPTDAEKQRVKDLMEALSF